MLRNPAHGRKLSLSHCCLGLTIGVLLLALTGCAERRAHAFPWATAVLVHPRLPTQVAPTLDGEPPPDLRPSIPETPLRLIAHSVPPRPEKPAAARSLCLCRSSRRKICPRPSSKRRTAWQLPSGIWEARKGASSHRRSRTL